MKLPKLILTDIDGVWTDGSMYYDQLGNEFKRFSTYDGAGVSLAHSNGIPVGIITGENTQIVINRAKKLKVDYIYQGVTNKLDVACNLCKSLNIQLSDVAYIGDDIPDIELLKVVGWSGTPQNGIKVIKSFVNIITLSQGGSGAFREFVETIIGR